MTKVPISNCDDIASWVCRKVSDRGSEVIKSTSRTSSCQLNVISDKYENESSEIIVILNRTVNPNRRQWFPALRRHPVTYHLLTSLLSVAQRLVRLSLLVEY